MAKDKRNDPAMKRTVAAMDEEINQLRSRIGSAPTQDEALKLAMSAAELCMQALKIVDDKSQRSEITDKCRDLLDDAERIKTDQDWTPGEDLIELSPDSQSRKTSPAHALIDADDEPAFPPRGTLPSMPTGSKAKDATSSTKAEGGYASSDPNETEEDPIPATWESMLLTPATSRKRVMPDRLLEPVSSRELATAEQIIVLKSSRLGGALFPPWKEPDSKAFELGEGNEAFTDPDEFKLPSAQFKTSIVWVRAQGALPAPNLPPKMYTGRPIDLVQDAGTDCSVVASLCAITARAERGFSDLLLSMFSPHDKEKKRLLLSANGKYHIRLNFNGSYRTVTVDDRLPVSPSRVLHVVNRADPSLLWPALLEKAYLKVRGGYGFPGSNSATDLWVLTGWIPEILKLSGFVRSPSTQRCGLTVVAHSEDTGPAQLWTKLRTAYKFGDVFITVGTGRMSKVEERDLGLVSEHGYAVLDLREDGSKKLMLLKNPWGRMLSRKGDGGGQRVKESAIGQNKRASLGEFWMTLNGIYRHFDYIYLNWNPALFSHRQDIHFFWDVNAHAEEGHDEKFRERPQFAVAVGANSRTWLVISRHFKDRVDPLSTESQAPGDIDLSGYIGMAVFDGGKRVYVDEGAVERSPLVLSPQMLVKMETTEPASYTILPTEQDLSPSRHLFTLSAFSTAAVQLSIAEEKYAYQKTLQAAWASSTSGGNSSGPTFVINPQFVLKLPSPSPVALLLESPNEEIQIHVMLLHGQGDRMQSLKIRDMIVESGDYRASATLAEVACLAAGVYTVICSTFQARQQGDFSLRVDSNVECELVQLPKHGAGRVSVPLTNLSFAPNSSRMAAPIYPRRLIRAAFVLQPMTAYSAQRNYTAPDSPVRLRIELGSGSDKHILAVSSGGEFSDEVNGLCTPEIDLNPDMLQLADMWLVVERLMGPARHQEHFSVTLVTDLPDAVSVGLWRGRL